MSNVTKLNDRVDVIAVFTSKRNYPFSFSWGGRKYVVEKVNLVYSRQSGNGLIISYSVTAQSNFFKLSFYTKEMEWRLEEMVTQ